MFSLHIFCISQQFIYPAALKCFLSYLLLNCPHNFLLFLQNFPQIAAQMDNKDAEIPQSMNFYQKHSHIFSHLPVLMPHSHHRLRYCRNNEIHALLCCHLINMMLCIFHRLMQIHKSATLSNDRHREFRLFPDIRKHRLIFR